jgi:hypothetical protein
MIQVSLVNLSTIYKDVDLPILANALQIQVTRDFLPIWGIDARIFYTPTGKNPTGSHWPLALFDNADVANALGYHDESATGQPLGKIFVATTLADGQKVEVTTSHELLEMLLDPYVQDASQDGSIFWAKEACDMVENDEYLIDIPAGWNGAGTQVPVSNFGLPAWWQSAQPGPYDFLKKLTKPLTLTPGGYASFLDITKPQSGWQQINGRMETADQRVRSRPHLGSRRALRNIPREAGDDGIKRERSTYAPGTEAISAET